MRGIPPAHLQGLFSPRLLAAAQGAPAPWGEPGLTPATVLGGGPSGTEHHNGGPRDKARVSPTSLHAVAAVTPRGGRGPHPTPGTQASPHPPV